MALGSEERAVAAPAAQAPGLRGARSADQRTRTQPRRGGGRGVQHAPRRSRGGIYNIYGDIYSDIYGDIYSDIYGNIYSDIYTSTVISTEISTDIYTGGGCGAGGGGAGLQPGQLRDGAQPGAGQHHPHHVREDQH